MTFIYKHAMKFAALQIISGVIAGLCSIWYGAWFPDAQTKYMETNKISEKPGFYDVSTSTDNVISLKTPIPYTGISFLLLVISGLSVLASAHRLSVLELKEKGFKKEQEDHSETRAYYFDSINDHLRNFFCKNIKIFDNTCRASLYSYDAAKKRFTLVFRHSPITKYENKGRVFLPENEGVVGAVFQNGDSIYIDDLPQKSDKKAYADAVNKKLELYEVVISRSVTDKLRMPSRCYFGYAIRSRDNSKKYAVLIIESTNPKQFDHQKLSALLNKDSQHFSKYVQHLVALDSKLNPYGGAEHED